MNKFKFGFIIIKMSRTPDKNDVTALKFTKVEKTEKIVTQYRALQTDRKEKEGVKSPLMIIMLLKKKVKSRIQHAFMRINLWKNNDNRRKIIARYMTSILKFKIKLMQTNSLIKLKNNHAKTKNTKIIITILNNWVNAKLKNQKTLAFLLLSTYKKNSNQNQSKYEIPSQSSGIKDSKAITTKKNEVNRSLDLGPKSVSASKMNISKKIQFNRAEDLPADLAKLQKQNDELRLMELSQDVRQVLKKIQRFDRFIYAQQAERTSKDALAAQIKRLQKIKNSQKQMRVQFYDNQLTITALFNHIKLISQLNKDIGDLSVLKQKYTADEAKRKQEQFKANLESKRVKSKQNNQAQIKQLIQNIDLNLDKKDYEKARVDITQLLSRFQKQDIVKNNVSLYRALVQTTNIVKDDDRFTQDFNKHLLSLKNIDFSQSESSIKILKVLQKDITIQINKLAKQNPSQKINNIYQSLESINNGMIQHFDSMLQKQKSQLKVKVQQKQSDDPLKKLAQIQKQLQSAKKTIEQLNQMKVDFENFNKSRNQFSKKVEQISNKATNKADFRKDREALRKDKLFINTKPYTQFFILEDLLTQTMDQQISAQMSNISAFFINLVQIFNKQKAKPEAKIKELFAFIETHSKKNPKLMEINKGLESLLTLTIKNTQNQADQRIRDQSGRKQIPQGLKRSGAKAQSQNQDPQQKIKNLTTEIQKYKLDKQKMQKQLLVVKQVTKISDAAQKQIQNIIDKQRRGEQWFMDLELLKKDKNIASNKNIQMIFVFFDIVADTLKKGKLIPAKLQKILELLLKVYEKKNLTPDKKFIQIEKIFENAIKLDPYLTQIFKVLNQWTKTTLIITSEQNQERSKQEATDVKKIAEEMQSERSKSKSLNDKIKELEKVNKEQALKISSMEKEGQTKEKKQISSQKKPPLSRSQQTLKNDQTSSKIQVELKTAKQKIVALQKQISNLKKDQSRRELSQKKETVSKKVQEQLKQLQQELKVRKQRENQQKLEHNKEISFRTQTQKSITTITTVLETKNFKNLDNQANKLLKTYEKDEKFADIAVLIANLIKLLVEKENVDGAKKKQIETITDAQSKDREKIDVITKIIKESEAEIKSGAYLANADYWDRFLVGLDPKSVGVVRDLVKILKMLTSEINIKNKKLQQISTKVSSQTNNASLILDVLKQMQQQINKKDYFKNDDGWNTLEGNVQSQDKVIKAIFRIGKKFSQTSRSKLSDERKLSEKSIKSYQGELEKMNNFISQYEIKLKQKQREHQELYKSYVELQKQSGDEPKRGNSLRTSRKSARSNSSQKQSEVKSIKQSIKNYVVDQKNMLEQLQMAENERIALVERINFLQQQLNGNYRIVEQLRGLNKQLQTNIADEHNNYQKEFQIWRQKTMDYNREIGNIRQQYQRQFEQKENKIIEQFQLNSNQQKIALQKYSRDFAKIQTDLNDEINRLREQLRLKNVEVSKNEEYDILKRTNTRLESDYNSLKLKLSQFETRINSADQISTQLQNSLRQNGQLQTQISSLTGRNRQLEQELQNLKSAHDRFKQEQRNWQQKLSLLQSQITSTSTSTRTTTTINNGNTNTNTNTDDRKKIAELEQQIVRIKAEQQQVVKREIDAAMKFQEEDFNKFLQIHDKQIETHFFTIVIPEKVKQVQTRISTQKTTTTTTVSLSSNPAVEKQLNDQIVRLKDSYRALEQQIQSRNRVAVEWQNKFQAQLRTTSDIEQRFNEEIRKLRNTNAEFEGKIRNYGQNQQKLKRYLIALQISWEEASSGILSEKTTSTYIRRETKEVVREVIKADPRQEQQINDLKSKLEEQIRMYRDLEQRFVAQQNENNRLSQSSKSMSDYRVLEDNLRRLQQNLDDVNRKYNQEQEGNRVIRNELATLKGIETNLRQQIRRNQLSYQQKLAEQERNLSRSTVQVSSKSNQQFRILQSKLSELSSKYNQELGLKRQLESRFNQSVTSYETRIQQISGEKILQSGRLNTQISGLKEKVNELNGKIVDRDRQIRSMEEQFKRETASLQGDVTRQYQDRIRNYERRITEYTSEISTIKLSQQQSLTSFNHQDCESKYKQLEHRSGREITDLKNKLADNLRISSDEIRVLKDVVNNQKLELTQLDLTIRNLKESKDEAQRQKEGYFNELRALTGDRDKQIFKLRSEYEQKIMNLTVEKSSLEARVHQNSQLNTTRVDPAHSIKVLELETQINNRNQEIRHLEQMVQRRRKEFQEEHQRLLYCQREREGLRMNCANMESHIIRLESDLSYLNTEIQRYKTTLNQIQGRESVLRNDIIRVRTETEMENSYHLKQQISHLKEEIIKITTTNVQQIHSIHTANFDNFDTGRIRKMIQDMEAHRGVDKYGFEANEMQMLKRINQEVTELVAANRQLQTRCVMLETQLNNDGRFAENLNFFGSLQQQMQELIKFLLEKQIIPNTESYSKFMYHSQETLSHQDFSSYFANWLNFIKSLFILANDSKSQELRQKAQEMIELKEQMNQILDKHIEFVEDESYDTLNKYKMIFSDVKILLREFMNTGNHEYVDMIWRSLEPDSQDELMQGQQQ